MDVYRLMRHAHAHQALAGIGAKHAGGRWNSKGTALAYTASSLELAVLEALMHLTVTEIPDDTMWLRYSVPDDAVMVATNLPHGWDAPGAYQPHVQAFGDAWVASKRSLALAVPATVLPMRRNVLINPTHSRFGEIKSIESGSFTWPTRLLARLSS